MTAPVGRNEDRCQRCDRAECLRFISHRNGPEKWYWHNYEECNYGNGVGENPCDMCATLEDCDKHKADWRVRAFVAERSLTHRDAHAASMRLALEAAQAHLAHPAPDNLYALSRKICLALLPDTGARAQVVLEAVVDLCRTVRVTDGADAPGILAAVDRVQDAYGRYQEGSSTTGDPRKGCSGAMGDGSDEDVVVQAEEPKLT